MKRLSSFLKSIVLFLISLLAFLSLVSYTPRDISFLTFPSSEVVSNFIGIGGAYLGFFLFFAFGYAAYFLPFCFFFLALDKLEIIRFSGLARNGIVKILAFLIFIIFLSALVGLFPLQNPHIQDFEVFRASGIVGFFLAGFFKKYLGIQGSFISIFLIVIVNAVLFFGFFFIDFLKGIKYSAVKIASFFREFRRRREELLENKNIKLKEKAKAKGVSPSLQRGVKVTKPEIKVYVPKANVSSKKSSSVSFDKAASVNLVEGGIKDRIANKDKIERKMKALEKEEGENFNPHTYKLPSLEILKVPPFADQREVKEDIEVNIKNLEVTLSDFGVEAKVVSVQKGPVVTMYELQPQSGTKIQRISSLADDIALAMKSSQVRVVAPIPGRGTVGVEIPNIRKHLVFLREVLEEKAFVNSSYKLTLAVGKDVSGNPVMADLGDMPHLLIAGATGTGKTVCINALISSLLFKAKPDEVKFILIDPKMVELASFAGIPHLITPIIVEAKKAFITLNWAVGEMERRYRILAGAGCRNIDAYNKGTKKLPFIIIIVDELADLMIVARESVETAIQRLAQLSRAVGIHLILATQRPSVDVITGVIKANFPARISFKVASKVDSRTVLDGMGADRLLGKGDLLFLKPGATKMIRAQGSYVDDEDIGNLTSFIKAQGKPVYEDGIIEDEKRRVANIGSDELFDEAVKVVLRAHQASASLLQRRMRVGYTRAARLLDLMEQESIVGPFCGSKAREILVDPESFLVERGWM